MTDPHSHELRKTAALDAVLKRVRELESLWNDVRTSSFERGQEHFVRWADSTRSTLAKTISEGEAERFEALHSIRMRDSLQEYHDDFLHYLEALYDALEQNSADLLITQSPPAIVVAEPPVMAKDGHKTTGLDCAIEIESVPARDLVKFAGRLSLGSWGTLLGILMSLVSASWLASRWAAERESPKSDLVFTDSSLVVAGKKAGLAYVMPSVVSWVQMERPTISGTSMRADQRITYELLALRNFDETEHLFQESFHSAVTELQYMPGSDAEKEVLTEPQPQILGWLVNFGMKSGEYRSVTTAVRRNYTAPLKTRQNHANRTLSTTEDEFCYPVGSDLIGEIVIGVESMSISFKDSQHGTRAYLFRSPVYTEFSPHVLQRLPNSPIASSIVTRFRDLQPNDIACVVSAW